MPNLIEKWRDFYNTEKGRKLVNWGLSSFGALVATGVIPLEMPIGPFTLGQILVFIGLRLPSTPPVKPGALKL